MASVSSFTSDYMREWQQDKTLSHEQFLARAGTKPPMAYDVILERQRLFVLPWRRGRPSHPTLKAWAMAAPDFLRIIDADYTGAVPLGLLGPLIVVGHCDPTFPFAQQATRDLIIPVVLSGTDYASALTSLRLLSSFLTSFHLEAPAKPETLDATVLRMSGQASRRHRTFVQAMSDWLIKCPWITDQDKNYLRPFIKTGGAAEALNYPYCAIARYLNGESPLICPHEIMAAKPPEPNAGGIPRKQCEKFTVVPIRVGDRSLVVLCGQGDRLRVRDSIAGLGYDDPIFVETNGDFITNTLQGGGTVEVVAIDQGAGNDVSRDEMVIDPNRVRSFQPNASEIDPNLLLEWVVSEAMRNRASDIHVEDFASKLRVRLAVDNGGFELSSFPRHVMHALATVIKNRSDMRGDGYAPQDSRFSFRYLNRMVDVRVSLVYSHGRKPKFTLRLLDKSLGIKNLGELGLSERDLAELRQVISVKYGLILMSGPTGSGKSSTLYACLSELNHPNKFIYTLEDPPEYEIEGVTQIACSSSKQTDNMLNFADTLSRVLRADPDVIMVGEIRDKATAKVSVDAALTGHLLLGTVHANDSATVLTRLMEFDVERMNLSEAMLLSSSQRLVRKLCPNCAHAVSVDDRVRKTFSDAKVDLSPRATHVFVPADGGCDECNKIGYKGRALVLEFLRFNDEMRAMIHRGETMQALRETAARAMGYRSLYQKGLELVSAGITSLEEVQAVCRR